MMRAVQVAILAFACVAAGSLHAQDPAKASEAKQAERKLADVRAQIRQLPWANWKPRFPQRSKASVSSTRNWLRRPPNWKRSTSAASS